MRNLADDGAVQLDFIAMHGFAFVGRLPVQDEAIGLDSSEVDMRILRDLAT